MIKDDYIGHTLNVVGTSNNMSHSKIKPKNYEFDKIK